MASANRWAGLGWVLAFLAGLYLISVYNSFFEQTLAFVYEPGSDRLFELQLSPNFSHCDKWTPLVPFNSCFFGEVASVEFRGKLHEVLRKREADDLLLRENPKAWSKEHEAEINRMVAGLGGEEEFFNISYFARHLTQVPSIIPKGLAVLHEFVEKKSNDVFAADIVISRSTLQVDSTEFEIVRNALFIRGRAAQKVSSMTLSSFETVHREEAERRKRYGD